MAEQERFSLLQMRRHFGFIDRCALEIGGRKENDVRLFRRFTHFQDLKTVLLGDRDRLAAFVQTDHHLYSTVLEVQRVRVTLGSKSDHRTHLSIEVSEVGVLIRVDFCWHNLFDLKGGTIPLGPWQLCPCASSR